MLEYQIEKSTLTLKLSGNLKDEDNENQRAALIFCSIKNTSLDTRGLLKKAVSEFQELEMTPMFGTEFIYSIDNSNNFSSSLSINF